jgi:WD40 repeat protein
VGKDRSTRIFDLWSRREQICQSPNEEWDNIVLFSPDGACLLTGSETRLALVKTDDCSVLLKVRANRAWTKQAVFSQDGERIGIATRDGRISVLDAKTGEELSISREKRASVSTLAFSPDARVIASGHHDGSVSIWRGDNGRLVHHLQAHGGSVRTVAFSPNGTLIASAGWDSPVLISRGADGTLLHRISAETSVVDKVAFLPDSRNLLMQSRGGSVQTVDALTGSPGIRFDIRGGGFFVFALSPCGRWMATANWDGDVQLWHVQSGVELASAYGDWDNVFVLRCSCEGRMLVVADLNRIFVWDCAAETAAFSIDAREDPLVVVAAALSSGVGTLLEHEREDFIFNDTPSDLSLALNALMTSEQRSQIVPTARTLHADRASDAYRNSALRPPRQSSPSAPLSAPSPQTE